MEDCKKTKVKDSNFEILRIISMLLIIGHHLALNAVPFSAIVFNNNKYILDIFAMGGKVGSNLFVVITAWFMVDKEFKFKRFIKLFGETWFYSVSILIILKIFLGSSQYSGENIIVKCLFPIISGQYWFITSYVLLIMFSPYLNHLINTLEKNKLKNLVIVLITLSVVIAGTIYSLLSDLSNSIIWFSILYLIIGYIKRYVDLKKTDRKINLLIGILSYVCLILSSVIINFIGHKLGDDLSILTKSRYFLNQNSIFVFIATIEIFLFFAKLPTFKNKYINIISSCTLGVYLIHDNGLIRTYLWYTILGKLKIYYMMPNFIFYSIVNILVVYIVCVIIDLIRQMTIEKIYLKYANIIYEKYKDKFYNLYKKITLEK